MTPPVPTRRRLLVPLVGLALLVGSAVGSATVLRTEGSPAPGPVRAGPTASTPASALPYPGPLIEGALDLRAGPVPVPLVLELPRSVSAPGCSEWGSPRRT